MNVTVTRNDRMYAGHRARYLVGPLDNMDDLSALRKRLQVIASRGPQNRIGLIPDPSNVSWVFDPTAESIVVTEGPPLDVSEPARVIADFPVQISRPTPMHIHLAAPFLLFEFDHGLGGGRLMTELIAAITSDSQGFADPAPASAARRAGLRAFSHELRTHPVVMVRALDELHMRSTPPVTSGQFNEPRQLVYARSEVDFLTELRARRGATSPGVTILALVTASILRALNSVGIQTDPDVSVMVDLSRHMPAGVGTLSNFVGVAPIAVAPPFRACSIASAMAEYTSGCRSLVRFGMATVADMLHSARGPVVQRCANQFARLVVTDHGELAAARKIRWQSDGDRLYLRFAPVGFSNQITLATNRVGAQLHLSASFYESQFDPRLIELALTRIVDTADDVSAIGSCK